MDAADVAAVAERGTLADGTEWPFPVTLDVPADAVPPDADHLVLADHEGSPLAVLSITERLPGPGPGPGLGPGPGPGRRAGRPGRAPPLPVPPLPVPPLPVPPLPIPPPGPTRR